MQSGRLMEVTVPGCPGYPPEQDFNVTYAAGIVLTLYQSLQGSHNFQRVIKIHQQLFSFILYAVCVCVVPMEAFLSHFPLCYSSIIMATLLQQTTNGFESMSRRHSSVFNQSGFLTTGKIATGSLLVLVNDISSVMVNSMYH